MAKPAGTYLTTQPLACLRRPKKPKEEAYTDLLQKITEFAHEAIGADACSAFLVDWTSGAIRQYSGTGYQEGFVGEEASKRAAPSNQVAEKPSDKQKLGITSYIISSGRPFLAKSTDEFYGHPHHLGKHDRVQLPKKKLEIATFLGMPIRGLEQDVRGMIKAERRRIAGQKALAFTEDDQLVLSNIAVAAGRCLDYMRMSLEGRPLDAVTAWVDDVISMASTSEPDPTSFANVVARTIAEAAHAESCAIFLASDDSSYLSQLGGCGYQAGGNLIRSYRIPKAGCKPEDCEGLTAWIAGSGQSFYARNAKALRDHPAHKGKFDRQDFPGGERCTAFFGVPIRVGAMVIGVLKLGNQREQAEAARDAFPSDVRRQVEVIAEVLALALWRLRAQAKLRYGVIEEATRIINEIWQTGGDLRSLIRRAIERVSTRLEAESCALFVKEGSKLVQYDWGAYGYARPIRPGRPREYDWRPRNQIQDVPKRRKDKVGLTVWIAAYGQKFVAKAYEEMRAHPHHKGRYDSVSFRPGKQCDSFMGIPLVARGETLGVLKIENKTVSRRHVPFTKEDELAFELVGGALANAIYYMWKQAETNRQQFIDSLERKDDKMWALGLRKGRKGLQGIHVNIPRLPDDAVVVRTRWLGVCGTDIQSLAGHKSGEFDLIEFHEALGKVVWTGKGVDKGRVALGDLVVPVVRRCQEWDKPGAGDSRISFDFRTCRLAPRCSSYRRPDSCPQGEYVSPDPESGGKQEEPGGYMSRGTGKCHGFGSEFFVDAPEWLVPAWRSKIEGRECEREFECRLILVEPLAVVWKMKRRIERVRPVRPFQDKMLTLGMGPIGYLATCVMCTMYPGLRCTAVDRVPRGRKWISEVRKRFMVDYRQLSHDEKWVPELRPEGGRFDIVIEATGCPQDVLQNAIDVLAPNGILVLLSVVGREGEAGAALKNEALNAIVRKNARIIGSVNEARDDFENAIGFLKLFHSEKRSFLDRLVTPIPLDPGKWAAIRTVQKFRATHVGDRTTGPKIALRAPR